MEQLIIHGGKTLKGSVNISGAKNAALAILPAVILSDGVSTIDNLPNIADMTHLVEILENLGAVCTFLDANTLQIDSTGIDKYRATYGSVKKIRASYYLLGALLGRFGVAEVAMPGGCNFGQRPTDLHIKGFKALGAKADLKNGMNKLRADTLTGANIYLDVVSVGATINIMLAATRAQGVTILENAAREPHVVDTANFLNMMGADIKGAGTDVIRITGVDKLRGANYTVIPDQIEAGTYMIAAAITGGDITVNNIIPRHMDPLSAKLIEMGCDLTEGDDYIRVVAPDKLQTTNVKTRAYPGFPTDLQPQFTTLLACAHGAGIMTENIWENRFQYVNELKRMGFNLTVEGRVCVAKGPFKPQGAEVSASDLRAGAALVLAGLVAEGTTIVGNAKNIYRGYEDIDKKLNALGADVRKAVAE